MKIAPVPFTVDLIASQIWLAASIIGEGAGTKIGCAAFGIMFFVIAFVKALHTAPADQETERKT